MALFKKTNVLIMQTTIIYIASSHYVEEKEVSFVTKTFILSLPKHSLCTDKCTINSNNKGILGYFTEQGCRTKRSQERMSAKDAHQEKSFRELDWTVVHGIGVYHENKYQKSLFHTTHDVSVTYLYEKQFVSIPTALMSSYKFTHRLRFRKVVHNFSHNPLTRCLSDTNPVKQRLQNTHDDD